LRPTPRTEEAAEKILYEGHGFTACRKTNVSEGYGLQVVGKCFAMNPVLAAEGHLPLQMALFGSLVSRAVKVQQNLGF
jgi:hypothetical protein